MPFLVMKARCAECLYGPDKIVSDARRKQLLKGIAERDDFFICHKATIAGEKACCAGDWETRGGGQMGRVAARLNAVVFVTEAELAEGVAARAGKEKLRSVPVQVADVRVARVEAGARSHRRRKPRHD